MASRPSSDDFRVEPSAIDNDGVISHVKVGPGKIIGVLQFGAPCPPGPHTLRHHGADREVLPPWRNLNHACEPNCELVVNGDAICVRTLRALAPGEELTIDYRRVDEELTRGFRCTCAACVSLGRERWIGKPG